MKTDLVDAVVDALFIVNGIDPHKGQKPTKSGERKTMEKTTSARTLNQGEYVVLDGFWERNVPGKNGSTFSRFWPKGAIVMIPVNNGEWKPFHASRDGKSFYLLENYEQGYAEKYTDNKGVVRYKPFKGDKESQHA